MKLLNRKTGTEFPIVFHSPGTKNRSIIVEFDPARGLAKPIKQRWEMSLPCRSQKQKTLTNRCAIQVWQIERHENLGLASGRPAEFTCGP